MLRKKNKRVQGTKDRSLLTISHPLFLLQIFNHFLIFMAVFLPIIHL